MSSAHHLRKLTRGHHWTFVAWDYVGAGSKLTKSKLVQCVDGCYDCTCVVYALKLLLRYFMYVA